MLTQNGTLASKTVIYQALERSFMTLAPKFLIKIMLLGLVCEDSVFNF